MICTRPRLVDVGADGVLLDREIDDLLLDVRGLVLVLEILAARHASDGEIVAHRRELDRRRARLAALIGESGRRATGLDHAA